MCKQAPAVRAVLTQANTLWPNRSKASDGICASPKHSTQNPSSDHEPHVNGYATAVDLTDDKASGCDADAWADWLVSRRDSRVKYLIRNREMVSSYPAHGYRAWTWRPYKGANPHEKHTHLSILPSALFDTSPWFPEEDEVTDADREAIAQRTAEIICGPDFFGARVTLHGLAMQALKLSQPDDTEQ